MLTELEIEGFKSFGSPAQTIRLGSLSFLVGANAVGKTNIIRALEFVQNAVIQDIHFAVSESGGGSEVKNKTKMQQDGLDPVRFRFKLETNIDFDYLQKKWKAVQFEYEMILDLKDDSHPVITKELFINTLEQDGKTFYFQLQRDAEKVKIVDPLRGHHEEEIPVPQREETRLALNVGFYAPPCVLLKELIQKWKFFNIIPDVARSPYRESPWNDLGKSGENLAVILHELEQDQENLEGILEGIRGILPGFQSIQTHLSPVEGKWAFQVLEEKISEALNPSSLSDGTIRLISLIIITQWSANHSSLLCIEEPEKSLHPHLFPYIVDIFRDATEKSQLIITTHNPDFLDFLEPNEIVLFDKVEGYTRVRQASEIDNIEIFKKDFSLGELWVQGALGGLP